MKTMSNINFMDCSENYRRMMDIILIMPSGTKNIALSVMADYCDELADRGNDIEAVYSDRLFLNRLIKHCSKVAE